MKDRKEAFTIEQEFALKVYQTEVDGASPEKLREMVMELIRQSMAKDNLFREILKQKA